MSATVGDIIALVEAGKVSLDTEVKVVEHDLLAEHPVERFDMILSLTGPAVLGLVF